MAAEDGSVETIRALVAAGAEVDHANDEGETAFWAAAMHGHVEALQTLLEAGAEVDHVTNRGYTALHAAAKNGHVQTLLEAGAQVDHARSGWTALHAAATNRHVEAIHALVGAGADLNHATNNGYTPLAMARLFNYHEAAVLALVQADATE